MSARELRRVEVLAQIDDGRLSVAAAAAVLGLTRRQVFRLLKRYRDNGASGIRHQARGKVPNNQIHAARRDYLVCLIRDRYTDFGPTLAAEMLYEHHGFEVSRETVRKRLRREHYGELIQIDGSEHRWFEDRGPSCTLLVFIDDATSSLMQLRFVTSESTFAYFEALELYLFKHGAPVAFYSDKHSVFRVAMTEAKSGHGMTQFGRALSELNIEILCANSSQAKRRVERANRTLQDRLVKELRLAGISDVDGANAFLEEFAARYNARFARHPARSGDVHRPLTLDAKRLGDVLYWRDQRYLGQQLAFSYDRKRIMLQQNEVTVGLVGKYVDTYAYADGRFEVRWQGHALPSPRTSG